MPMKRERLVKVRAESELLPGMIVVAKPCCTCGVGHRRMLLARVSGRFRNVHTGHITEASWLAEPKPRCWGPTTRHFNAAAAIEQGRLYRVIDGLERDAETTKDREMERVR